MYALIRYNFTVDGKKYIRNSVTIESFFAETHFQAICVINEKSEGPTSTKQFLKFIGLVKYKLKIKLKQKMSLRNAAVNTGKFPFSYAEQNVYIIILNKKFLFYFSHISLHRNNKFKA